MTGRLFTTSYHGTGDVNSEAESGEQRRIHTNYIQYVQLRV